MGSQCQDTAVSDSLLSCEKYLTPLCRVYQSVDSSECVRVELYQDGQGSGGSDLLQVLYR